MRALVTGATGFIGRALVRRLTRPRIATRNARNARKALGDVEAVSTVPWDPLAGPAPREVMTGIDAVFHLAGEPVAGGRWTVQKKDKIRDSRVLGTRNLVAGIRELPAGDRPQVLVSASAVGYYGSRGDETLTEASGPGADFLARVCAGWEAEAMKAGALGLRVVTPRIGVVIGQGGGALAKMLLPFRLGLGGRLGDGRQWTSWIEIEDLVELMLFAAQTDTLSGPVNAVSPHPVTNLEFTKALAGTLNRPAIFPMPAAVLRLIFGEAASVLLASTRALPDAAMRAGFRFRTPEIEEALQTAIRASDRR